MPQPSILVLFCLAALILMVTPGPAVIYLVTRSIAQGRRAGFVSQLGIATGDTVYVAAAAVGLSALVVSSANDYAALRYAGAVYLVYLGIRKLLGRDREESGDRARSESFRQIYLRGVLVSVLNPKTALFFFSFLPQFADPAHGPLTLQLAFLGLVYIALGVVVDGTYVLAASSLGVWLRSRPSFTRRQEQISGGVFVGLGLVAALSTSRTSRA